MVDLPPLGWFVTDPDGNVIDSGPVTVAEMADELKQQIAEALGITTPEGE